MKKGGSKKVKTKKQSKIVALMLSASMAMTAVATNVHAEEAEVTNVWKMGDKTYESLQAAVDETSEQAAIIELLNNASGSGVKIPSGKNITIDFGGHVYDVTGELVGSTGTVSQAFQLLKGSDITLKNGEIKSAAALMLVQNYANLTVDGMKLDGSGLKANNPAYTLSNNCGTVVIKDTEIIAKIDGFAFDVFYWPKKGYGEGVSVTVEGNSVITGNVEYDSDGTADGIQNIAEKAKLTIKDGSFSGKFVTSGLNEDGKTGISISGGTFAVKPDEAYLAEGFHLNEDGSVVEDGTEEKEALAALTEAIAAADKAFDENKTYTAESKEAFDNAYHDAKAAAEKTDATVAELKAATDALIEATKNLEEATEADLKTQLDAKIAEAETKLSDGNTYTEESLNALNDALAAAKGLGEDADDEAIQTALDHLTEAIDNLQLEEAPTLDLSKLLETIAAAKTALQEAIDSGLYTPESLTALEAAIAAAEKLCEEVTTQALIDQEVKALEAAINGLTLIEEPDPKPDPDPEQPDGKTELSEPNTKITVSASSDVLDSDTSLVVNVINPANADEKVAEALNNLKGDYVAYDIMLMKDNVEIQPSGTVKVTMRIPEGYDLMKLKLYHISNNGEVTPVLFTALQDKLSFETDHFSIYVMVNEANEVSDPNKPDNKPENKPENKPTVKPTERPENKPASDPKKDNSVIKDSAAETPNTGDSTTALAYVLLLAGAGACIGFAYMRKGNNA